LLLTAQQYTAVCDISYIYYNITHCIQKKSDPLKDFTTTNVNLHQIKYISTHIPPHLFQMTCWSFWKKNSYSDWEIKL